MGEFEKLFGPNSDEEKIGSLDGSKDENAKPPPLFNYSYVRTVPRKVLRTILWVAGASGALVLWQKLDKEFAVAIDKMDIGFIIAWLIIAGLVVGCFWLANKL